MRTQEHYCNGVLYKVEYKPELSQRYYTQKSVYHIKTKEESYTKAHKAIQSIMADGSWTEGLYRFNNDRKPSMTNALHPYHKFSYDEILDVYVYTYIRPYDD